jgi:hypothetical protein
LALPSNVGAAAALNRLLAIAKGLYIARQDADDIALPKRFTKQVAYLENNQDVGLVGAWVQEFEEKKLPTRRIKRGEKKHLAWEPAMAAFHMAVDNPVWGCSMMMRTSLARQCGGFGAVNTRCEDGWIGAKSLRAAHILNLPEVLLHYRVHPDNTSRVHQDQILDAMIAINQFTTATLFDLNLPKTYGVMASLPLFWEQRDGVPGCRPVCTPERFEALMAYYSALLQAIYFSYGHKAYNRARAEIEGCVNHRLLAYLKGFPLAQRITLTTKLKGRMTPGLGLHPLTHFMPDFYTLFGMSRRYDQTGAPFSFPAEVG